MVDMNHDTAQGAAKLRAISTFVSALVESLPRRFVPDSMKSGGVCHGQAESGQGTGIEAQEA
jgi:hypothetical protein